MPRDAAIAIPPDRRLPLTNPWPLLGPALGAAVVVLLLHSFAPEFIVARALLVAMGVVTGLGAVGIALRTVSEDVESRFRTAGIVALASAVPFVCGVSLDQEWDTVRMLLNVFVGVGLAGAAILLLPRLIRRLTLTLLVLLHFFGILCSVGSPAPRDGQASWLVNQLWIGVYRPYLQFMYLTNAYHFYSPDPGPPMLLWFRIEYEGGKSRWVEIPSLREARSKLAFLRGFALTESTNQLYSRMPDPPFDFDSRLKARYQSGLYFKNGAIPLVDDSSMPPNMQFRQPIAWAKQLIRSYARYVCKHYPYKEKDEPHREEPDLKPVKVKVYRVVHSIPRTDQIAIGFSPFEATTYLPYYQGDFDPEGNLLNGPVFKDCKMVDPGDPFLYWLIPIRHELKPSYVQRYKTDGTPIPPEPSDYEIKDYLKIHAGDKESFWLQKGG